MSYRTKLIRASEKEKNEIVTPADLASNDYIIKALSKTSGNISKAARELGISRVTLYDLMNKLKIEVKKYRKNSTVYQ